MERKQTRKIEKTIKNIWPKVRKKHLFPQIPTPIVSEGSSEKVAIEMKAKQIIINPLFLEKLQKKMPEEEVVEALLDHGITHYTYCPWDFTTHLFLYQEAKKVLKDKELTKISTGYFLDVVSDTYCVKGRGTKLPELYKNMEKEGLDQVISSLYQNIWGIDLGTSNFSEVTRRLSRIPYLDRAKWGESIKRFSRVIKPFLEKEEDKKKQNPMGNHSVESYGQEEVDKGLRDFAFRVKSLKEFKEVISDFTEELSDMGYGTEGGMGRGKSMSFDADILFYQKLAENYTLPIRKLPLEGSGSLYPHSHSPWEVGKPVQDIDIWTSFGKIMPGITKIWQRKEGEILKEKEKVPDCIIVIDSSGSMQNPRIKLSYSVLGAMCAASSYLKAGAKVAAYNFSDAEAGGKEVLNFTSKRWEIYKVLCRYFGGGTNLSFNEIENLRKETNPDIFLITDMQITNLEKVIDYFLSVPNRITAVYIGENKHVIRFKQRVEKRQNISFFGVKKKEDIPKIILGKIKEYLRANL